MTLPKFTLTGITTFGGKRAFVKMQATGEPGQQAGESQIVLREGQREGEIEVLTINPRLGNVEIRWSGRPFKVAFEDESSRRPQPVPR